MAEFEPLILMAGSYNTRSAQDVLAREISDFFKSESKTAKISRFSQLPEGTPPTLVVTSSNNELRQIRAGGDSYKRIPGIETLPAILVYDEGARLPENDTHTLVIPRDVFLFLSGNNPSACPGELKPLVDKLKQWLKATPEQLAELVKPVPVALPPRKACVIIASGDKIQRNNWKGEMSAYLRQKRIEADIHQVRNISELTSILNEQTGPKLLVTDIGFNPDSIHQLRDGSLEGIKMPEQIKDMPIIFLRHLEADQHYELVSHENNFALSQEAFSQLDEDHPMRSMKPVIYKLRIFLDKAFSLSPAVSPTSDKSTIPLAP